MTVRLSCIVNLTQISRVTKTQIKLADGTGILLPQELIM